jgi:hypothetical protein
MSIKVKAVLITAAVLICGAVAFWYFSPYQRCLRFHGNDQYAKLFCGHVSY